MSPSLKTNCGMSLAQSWAAYWPWPKKGQYRVLATWESPGLMLWVSALPKGHQRNLRGGAWGKAGVC